MAIRGYHILMVEWHLEAWFLFPPPKLQCLVLTLRISRWCQIQDAWECFPIKLH